MAEVVDGETSLHHMNSTDLRLFLAPSPDLSRYARAAARHLYSSLFPLCPNPSKPPLDELLVDPNFDAEQIWSQIDLLNRPVMSLLRKEIGRIERAPLAIPVEVKKAPEVKADEEEEEEEEKEAEEEEDEDDDDDDDDDDNDDDDEEEEEEEEGERRERNGVEDEFLKMEELEEYLEKDEEREFGSVEGKRRKKVVDDEDEGEDEDDDDGEEDDEDSEFGDLYGDGDDGFAEDARYDDFFVSKKQRGGNKKDDQKKGKKSSMDVEFHDEPVELDELDEQKDDGDVGIEQNENLSTHEKHLLKMRSEIERLEKESLEPKHWTMRGEVTAADRPKNSALEVDIEFERNMRPPPVVTEELTASLEELIKKRIIEGHFDDVQRAPALPTKPPKELKELDESKSKKGLAEIYEEDFAQTTGLASAPLSSSDEQKKATILFKKLCLKLDALSHFHFAPKPVIEDMSIQANVPALAMEEIAPVAISDAAMLAPEEVFKGKGDVKEEVELTQAERKRRRANKKRKFKAETAKREAKKARQNAASSQTHDAGKERE